MNTISPLAYIHPNAKLGENNYIGPFCYIDDNVVLGNNNTLHNSVTIARGARIGSNNEFFPGASISTKPQDLKYKDEDTLCEIGNNNSIRENITISRGTASRGKTLVVRNNLLMESVHVAHDNAIISASVLCHQFCHIGGYVMIQGGSRFSKDIPPFIIAGKEPTKYAGLNLVGLRRRGFSNELIALIHDAYRLLYSKGIKEEGIQEIKKNLQITPEIQYIIDFVQSSKRGIIT